MDMWNVAFAHEYLLKNGMKMVSIDCFFSRFLHDKNVFLQGIYWKSFFYIEIIC